MGDIRILLADDHRIFRSGLRLLLQRQDGLDVVGEADNGRAALQLAQDLAPSIVIMDVSMPELNGIIATRRILEACPYSKVIALTMHADSTFVTEMFKAGAVGYLTKGCASAELTHAIRAVNQGEIHMSPDVTKLVMQDYLTGLAGNEKGEWSKLSERQREVLQLISEGQNTKQIARKLHLSPKTIESHRLHIMDKLDLHSIAELTKYALRKGLTTLD